MRALRDLRVLAVDCQATGASPAFGHVLELGWGVVSASDEAAPAGEAHWIALPEGHVVPGEVRRLTGWRPTAAAEAIPDAEAWRRLRSAVAHDGPVPTAIHYARFELSFLREWWTRLEPEAPFPFDPVCVHAVAHRLYPELPRLSLRALAGYLGHGLTLERRSLGHVEATAFIWRRICADLIARDIDTWEALQGWLATRAAARARSPRPRYPIDSQRFRSLPDQPGVYRFLRRNGDVLYVGKAASLKKRTTSHFIGRASKLLVPEMLTQVSDIAVTVAASVLEAALLENETIKALNPPYNVQLRSGDPRVWYSDPGFATASAVPSDVHRLGPLSSEHALRPLGALANLLAGAAPTLSMRAHAVGVSALWPPDEGVFLAGWALLLARHEDAGGPATEEPRWRALQLARALLATAVASSGAADGRDAGETTEAPVERAWDPERVARHLERAAGQAYRALRRARWLRLVHDCDVLFREPDAPCPRTLRIRGGQIDRGDKDGDGEGDGQDAGAVTPAAARGHLETSVTGSQTFDRARYDRLRILTTELKRILRDGGDVRVITRAGRQLDGRRLRGILAVV